MRHVVYIWGMNGIPIGPAVVRALVLGVALLGPGEALAQTPSFTMVGYPSGGIYSSISGLSADGRSAAGVSGFPTTISTPYPGFVWSAETGRHDFGLEAGVPLGTWSLGISGDGHAAVGYSWTTQGGAETAFRWSGPGTFQSLGTMGWSNSRATGASNDGTTVVGYLSTQSGSAQQAFRWTPSTGMQTVGPLFSEANAISRDGSTIVGETAVTSGAPQAFRWTQAGGVQPLPPLPGTYFSYARGVSADGRDVVGSTTGLNVDYPTLWHDGVPMLLSRPTNWYHATPFAVSDDGQVVVGTYDSTQTYGASIWTPTTGFMPMADYLAGFGITLPTGVWLERCTSVSADGRTFGGKTFGPAGITQGFVATIPAPGACAAVLACAVVAVRRRR